jgi:glycolate oxidase FAD binding subunit
VTDVFRPAADWELKSIIAQFGQQNVPVEITGAGTKRAIGHPVAAGALITTASLRGITLYEPTELVMSARAGTPVSQVEVELASRGQMLPFEPIDFGPALGAPHGLQTIGAVFATNNSGSRRISTGSARDHLIGLRGVNGRAEIFKAGGRVMKNVTGYDVARGLTGSWGTLAVLTEVTFKVVPLPDDIATIIYTGLPEDLAVELMSLAMGTPYEVSGTVHLPAAHAQRDPALGLRALRVVDPLAGFDVATQSPRSRRHASAPYAGRGDLRLVRRARLAGDTRLRRCRCSRYSPGGRDCRRSRNPHSRQRIRPPGGRGFPAPGPLA